MRKQQHVTSSQKTNTGQEAEFNFGYFYRTIEEHVNAYAAQAGNPYSVTDIAVRVGRLLEAKALREELGSPQLVPQVREDSAGVGRGGGTQRGEPDRLAEASLHVRPRGGRTLSAASREKIAVAQRARWAKTKRTQRAKKGGGSVIPWGLAEDAIIVGSAKGQPAPELARKLTSKLKARTEGAIRQRIARLVAKGALKQSKGKGVGGVPNLMVAAA